MFEVVGFFWRRKKNRDQICEQNDILSDACISMIVKNASIQIFVRNVFGIQIYLLLTSLKHSAMFKSLPTNTHKKTNVETQHCIFHETRSPFLELRC